MVVLIAVMVRECVVGVLELQDAEGNGLRFGAV
jgi:hypothetical protein